MPEFSNSDLLRQEHASFADVRMPLNREGGLDDKELPFIVGVIDDFAGNAPGKNRGDVADRRFEQVGKFGLNDRMSAIAPGLEYQVKSTLPTALGGTGNDFQVRLRFSKMRDFDPVAVAQQVPAMKALLELRAKLLDLRRAANGDPSVRKEIEKLIAELLPDR